MHELALFAGSGGGILGGTLLGWTTICGVEINPYSASVLLARQNDDLLPPFPVWDDIRTFDGRPWRGLVDVVSGGFPCQDISAAGKGAGLAGSRSGLWPRWGTMRNGECSERTTSERLTSAKEFGYLHTIPTPTVCNAPNAGGNTRGPKSLKEVAATNWLPGQLWPTPTVQDSKNTRGASQLRRKSPPLNAMVRLYPTPRLTGMCGGSGAAAQIDQLFSTGTITDVERTSMRSGSGGALNPQWVAWLMGWPLGWSSLQPLAMDKFQQWRRLHS